MKSDGQLARCPLKGTMDDAIFAVLCGCGHNFRKILTQTRALLTTFLAVMLANINPDIEQTNGQAAA